MHCTDDFMWKKLVRNLLTDLQKGLNLLKKPKKVFRLKYKVVIYVYITVMDFLQTKSV